jgi:CheY-like chemotaxis protein
VRLIRATRIENAFRRGPADGVQVFVGIHDAFLPVFVLDGIAGTSFAHGNSVKGFMERKRMITSSPAPSSCLRVLVISPDIALGDLLRKGLPERDFQVIACGPGPAFMEAARREHPEIAVIDRVNDRPDMASMEILVLKDIRPNIRIIALSGSSSPQDARIVEHGVFFYMATPTGAEVIQVIEAAAKTFRRTVPGVWSRGPVPLPASSGAADRTA